MQFLLLCDSSVHDPIHCYHVAGDLPLNQKEEVHCLSEVELCLFHKVKHPSLHHSYVPNGAHAPYLANAGEEHADEDDGKDNGLDTQEAHQEVDVDHHGELHLLELVEEGDSSNPFVSVVDSLSLKNLT